MAIGINSELQNFFNFASRAASTGLAAEVTQDGRVRAASKTACALSRLLSCGTDTQEAIDINNHVRETFVNALKRQFNVEDFTSLPRPVKDALVGSHAATAEEDFGFNAEGHVTSGKPLTARRITAVMMAIRKTEVSGDKLMVDFAPDSVPELQGKCVFKGSAKALAKISPYIASANLKSEKTFVQKAHEGLKGPEGDKLYGQATSTDGLRSRDPETGAPKNFMKDYHRTSLFVLPGVGRVSYRPEEGQKALDDVTNAVTNGKIRHFKNLSGKDLKKVCFVLTMLNQTIVNAAFVAQTNTIFQTDSEGGPLVSFNRNNGQITLQLEIDDKGGITFKGKNKAMCETFVGLVSEDLENGPDEEVMVGLNPQKSFCETTIELHYSAKTLDKIVSANWNKLSAPDLMKLIKADTRTFGGTVNLEERADA